MSVMLLAEVDTGGIPVAPGSADGSLLAGPGSLQYGPMLLGTGSKAGWRELIGWRDQPAAQIADVLKPQAHGAYAGDVFGDALSVTFDFLLRGSPESKAAALATIERYAPMDGIERALAVNDGAGVSMRMARVIGRQIPQGIHFHHAPVAGSLQFLCADPRRYGLASKSVTVKLPVSSGGLEYPLVYPLFYGESATGSASAFNAGSTATPLVATFYGPLDDPVLVGGWWRIGFRMSLADGETLVVDTAAGTALLNGNADRLYMLRNDSSPLERCVLQPGTTQLTLSATNGAGRVVVAFRDARM